MTAMKKWFKFCKNFAIINLTGLCYKQEI
jgi:hypothetical protein